jgi:hypothetical protein
MTLMKNRTQLPAKSGARLSRRGICLASVGMISMITLAGTVSWGAESRSAMQTQAADALKKAATFYRTKAASHGGYVYFTSLDFQQRWGEGVAEPDQIFVQPPGTPAVGMAFLEAYKATGDTYYLDAARDAAKALVYGQLKSGAWTQTVNFNPQSKKAAAYRNGKGKGPNNSTLDDDQSQSAIRFLVRMDQALAFKDPEIHQSVQIALEALLKAQFPNGGFPQVWTGPVAAQPVVKASYAESWPRIWPHENYWNYYTLNDGLTGTVSDTLLTAIDVYKEDRYKKALVHLGDFLILAQMPDPQPAWAQQYSFDMHPTWARKFEPPAIAGYESEVAIETLMKVYQVTKDPKYLAPIPKAIAYLKKCQLPNGQIPRYHELKTNKPLYMNRKDGNYFLTYDDTDLPSHYGWKRDSDIDKLAKEYEALKAGKALPKPTVSPAEREKKAQQAMQTLDDQGRWVSTYAGERLVGQPKFATGFQYLDSGVFNENVEALSSYLAATRAK